MAMSCGRKSSRASSVSDSILAEDLLSGLLDLEGPELVGESAGFRP